MTFSRVEMAARNNALWCDSLCRAHGVPGEFHETAWLNRKAVPRFYPNLVSLTSQCPSILAYIKELAASDLPEHWAVKDSFCDLDLTTAGFQILFEANWLWRSAEARMPKACIPGISWVRLQEAAELAEWESAWNGKPENESSNLAARLFLPALLDDPNIAFIAACRGDEIVAGAIANRSGEAAGLSNVFTPSKEAESLWAGCVATAMQIYPGLPLVDYESGPELGFAEAVGFERLQPLRVWVNR
jgi:hypothetical protein